MKKAVNVFVAICVLMTLITTHIFAISQFTDFEPKGVQRDVVDFVTSNKIIYGYEDGTFKPYSTITRAEFTTMICRFFGYNLAEYATFDDVGSSHWASKYIQAGVSKNAINGVGDNKFAPDDNMEIIQAMKILTVLAGCTEGEDMLAGYPVAYLTVAGKYGLYNNLVQKDAFYPMKRIDGAMLIYNTYLYMKNKDVKKDFGGESDEKKISVNFGTNNYLILNKEYLAQDGMIVILKGVEITEKQGSTQYKISYKLTNGTADKELMAGTFKLFLTNSTGETEYGLLGAGNYISPGDSAERTYTFVILSNLTPLVLEYNCDNDVIGLKAMTERPYFRNSPIDNALHWKVK